MSDVEQAIAAEAVVTEAEETAEAIAAAAATTTIASRGAAQVVAAAASGIDRDGHEESKLDHEAAASATTLSRNTPGASGVETLGISTLRRTLTPRVGRLLGREFEFETRESGVGRRVPRGGEGGVETGTPPPFREPPAYAEVDIRKASQSPTRADYRRHPEEERVEKEKRVGSVRELTGGVECELTKGQSMWRAFYHMSNKKVRYDKIVDCNAFLKYMIYRVFIYCRNSSVVRVKTGLVVGSSVRCDFFCNCSFFFLFVPLVKDWLT